MVSSILSFPIRVLILPAIIVLVLTALPLYPARADGIIYVVPGGTGSRDGSDWANAQDLSAALVGATTGTQLWVKSGIYTPTSTTDRTATFTLVNGVAIYGGFAGNENALDQRNVKANPTTLSGDLLRNDGANFSNTADNSYNVVTGNEATSTALLDGVTIRDGNANGDGSPSANTASGGGMYSDTGNATLTNIIFTDNQAGVGAGMYNINYSNPTLTNVTFTANQASQGGGISNSNNSAATLINVTFSGNQAAYNGGGMSNDNSSPTLVNIIFSGNSASYGSGIANYSSSPTLTNVTLSGNRSNPDDPDGGGTISNLRGSSPTIQNSIVWGNSAGIYNSSDSIPNITYSDIQNMAPDDGKVVLSVDPGFTLPIEPASAPTLNGNLRLRVGSPVINIGNTDVVPTRLTIDRDGNPRIVGRAVDLGAYEWQMDTNPPDHAVYLAFVISSR